MTKLPLPVLARKMKKLASLQILSLKLLLNGRGFSKFKKLYRLKGELGQGGFGIVYRAVRIADDLPVAVKFIERRHVREWGKLNDERLPMEICMLARCARVPGVIALVDWFSMPEGFLIVMERPSPCIDLFDFIHAQTCLGEDMARFLFRQIAHTALSCAERKVLHRDLKDENVVVDLVAGRTRLIDFGAATLLKKTRYYDFQGTRLYCPPEWFLHSLYLGREAAVWSLGVLLYNMLNGRLPFSNEKDICTAHLLGPLPFYTQLSEDVRDLCEKCLSFDPFARPSLEQLMEHPWMCRETPDWLQLSASLNLFGTAQLRPSIDGAGQLQGRDASMLKVQCHRRSLAEESGMASGGESGDEEHEDDNESAASCSCCSMSSSLDAEAEEESEEQRAAFDRRRGRAARDNGDIVQCKNKAAAATKPDTTVLSGGQVIANEKKLLHQQHLALAVRRRNAKTSHIQPMPLNIVSIHGAADADDDENGTDEKTQGYSIVRPSLRQFNLKNSLVAGAGSFDSGTSSALHSPRSQCGTPQNAYPFN